MHVCFHCVCFSFSVVSQEIGWEERLRNDLFCVEWDVKRQLNQLVLCWLTPVGCNLFSALYVFDKAFVVNGVAYILRRESVNVYRDSKWERCL